MSAKKTAAGVSLREAAAQPYVASALRTLETGREGLAALKAAIADGLGASFIAAVETIRQARGRLIVTGMGKSGHIAPQDRRDARLHRHAGLFRPPRRCEPWRPRHDHAGRRDAGALLVGRDRRAASLIDYSRRFRITLIAVTVSAESTLGKAADIVLVLPAGA